MTFNFESRRRVRARPTTPRGLVAAGVALLALFTVACGDSTGLGTMSLEIRVATGATTLRQGEVAELIAEARDASGQVLPAQVEWEVAPAGAGHIRPDGRFVGYVPGSAQIIARAGTGSAALNVTIEPRGATLGSFVTVGRGRIDDRFTSDLWVNGTFAYTGTWGTRIGADTLLGNRMYAWDISSPGMPVLTDSVAVDAGTVNDVKIREDGTLAVLTHEGSLDGMNGITLLDASDPLHPQVISRFTSELETGVHNVWVEGDFVYVVVDGSNPSRGLRVVDISDPANPSIAASFWGGPATGGFGQFLHDVYVRDGLAFLSHWDSGLIILDVGNGVVGGSPQNPIEVGRVVTEGGDVHNAWYWPARGYVFVGEEDFSSSSPGVVHVVDARDLANPREVATFAVEGTTPHNLWLDEEREILFVGWYEQGVRAIDVSGELLGELDHQGRELAASLYDGLGTCFGGFGTCAWAPQLHEGHVFVSDTNTGLWVLRLDF